MDNALTYCDTVKAKLEGQYQYEQLTAAWEALRMSRIADGTYDQLATISSEHHCFIKILGTRINADGSTTIEYELHPQLRSLNELIKQSPHQTVAISETIKIIKGICAPIKILHSNNMLHRDIKPQNYFLVDDTILLGDLETVTQFGTINNDFGGEPVGTLGFSPYEQCNSNKSLSNKADIHALGFTIACLLTGTDADKIVIGDTSSSTLLSRLLSQYGPNTFNVISKATEYYPEDRHKDVEEFERDLIHAIELDIQAES